MAGLSDGMNGPQRDDFIEALCQDTWKDLYRFIYYKVQNREEAQDITQETYARAISYLEEHNVRVSNYGSYLRSISVNIIRDQWRIRKRRGSNINIEDISQEEFSVDDFADAVNERTVIDEAMKHLTPEQQKVIQLRIIKGYSAAETAKIMRRKEGTIRVIQFRAIKTLAEIIEASGRLGR